MRVLIAGCGYVGLSLGSELVRQGHQVFGLKRTGSGQTELAAAGITLIRADITQPETLAGLPSGCDWVVHCASAAGGGIDDYRAVYLQGARNLLEWLKPNPPRKFVYTSSTSVYGQNDGSWVDETSPTEPQAATAKVLVDAEKLLMDAAWRVSFPAVVLRVAGIYGPARGYWLKQFLSGEARIEEDGSRFLNMIHRDDVTGAIISALKSGRPGEIYNAADDEPVTQLELFKWLATSLGKSCRPRGRRPPIRRGSEG